MMSISDTIHQAIGSKEIKAISQQIGADKRSTKNALENSLPMLLSALTRNATQGEGANEIFNAVTRDHDGSLLDHPEDLINAPDQGHGDGILGHLLGSHRQTVEAGLGRASGLDSGAMGKLLTILAPMVMGALGKAQRSNRLDASSLVGMLNQETSEAQRANPKGMTALNTLLDADNDGDVDLSDLTRGGLSLLRRFLH